MEELNICCCIFQQFLSTGIKGLPVGQNTFQKKKTFPLAKSLGFMAKWLNTSNLKTEGQKPNS